MFRLKDRCERRIADFVESCITNDPSATTGGPKSGGFRRISDMPDDHSLHRNQLVWSKTTGSSASFLRSCPVASEGACFNNERLQTEQAGIAWVAPHPTPRFPLP